MGEHVIQNPDINVGPGSYKGFANDELLVVGEPFYTIQGEGPYAGHPALFVRLAGCNRGAKDSMGCAFCDTAFQFNLGRVLTFNQIELELLDRLQVSVTSKRPMLVITGGEPMMQNNLAAFCHYLLMHKWPLIQIESNGDRLVPGLPETDSVRLVVSPKVSRNPTTGEWEYREPKPAMLARVNSFKFLIEAIAGSPYNMPPRWTDTCGSPVYISPITHYARPVVAGEHPTLWNHRLVDVPRTRANYTYAAELAMRYGYRLSHQSHLLWGVP